MIQLKWKVTIDTNIPAVTPHYKRAIKSIYRINRFVCNVNARWYLSMSTFEFLNFVPSGTLGG
jgi:hypothetical protein